VLTVSIALIGNTLPGDDATAKLLQSIDGTVLTWVTALTQTVIVAYANY